MMEALATDHAAGLALAPENFRDVVFDKVASYGAHYPSSKQDFDAGCALEIDSLNGYVASRARANGCSATENEALVEGGAANGRREGRREGRRRRPDARVRGRARDA